LLLVARHAVDAHRSDPNPLAPASPQVAQLVFGAGPHACPGAKLARAQMADLLAALAPYRPVVTRARADRRSALPSWRSLVIRATRPTGSGEHPPTTTGSPGTDPMRPPR
jgi:cytochrome P450